MNTQARIIIGVLVAAVVGLGITVGVMAAGDNDRGGHMGRQVNLGDGYGGMMQSMGDMDSGGMLKHMREALGEDGNQRMLDHFRDHRNGGPMAGNAGVDQMMHQMMDGMMQRMPMDGGNMMPGSGPGASKTATP